MPANEPATTIDTNASDENDLSLRDTDDMASFMGQHHRGSSPVRRQYLMYGLRGKRHDSKLGRNVEHTDRVFSHRHDSSTHED